MTTSLASSAFDSLRLDAVHDQDALRRVYELPKDTAIRKQMTELTEQTRRLIGCSSLVLQLTAVGKPPASARVLGIEEVYPHCPKSLLRSGAWKPDQWLPADAQPTSAEVTLAQLRMPELTIADIEQAEADSLKYRYE